MPRTSPIFAVAAIFLICGCASARRHPAASTKLATELSTPLINTDVQARLVPPIGWNPEPLKITRLTKHQLWLSPTRQTAYGVIYFKAPIPLSYDIALWAFLDEMKKTEGASTLVEKQWDENLPALRFVAFSNFHRVEVSFFVSGWNGGWTGWAVYAGTQANQPIDIDELRLARLARENTSIGLERPRR